jgi:hypothetical protein
MITHVIPNRYLLFSEIGQSIGNNKGFGNWITCDLVAGLDVIMPGPWPLTKNNEK